MTDDDVRVHLAGRVRQLRGKRTLQSVADAAGTYPASLSKIERGQLVPGSLFLRRLAIALGCSTDDLVGLRH